MNGMNNTSNCPSISLHNCRVMLMKFSNQYSTASICNCSSCCYLVLFTTAIWLLTNLRYSLMGLLRRSPYLCRRCKKWSQPKCKIWLDGRSMHVVCLIESMCQGSWIPEGWQKVSLLSYILINTEDECCQLDGIIIAYADFDFFALSTLHHNCSPLSIWTITLFNI